MFRKTVVVLFLISISLDVSAQNCDAGCQMEQARIAQENSIIFWEEFNRDLDARNERRNAQLGNDNANRTQNWWGAISVNSQSGAWFWVANNLSTNDALQNVKKACPDDQCIPLAIFRNTCVAAANNSAGSLFWADDIKQGIASKKAVEKCQTQNINDHSCKVPKDNVACSGYNYSKWQGKASNFNRGGLIGVMSPKLMGIPDIKPPEVIYDPRMLDFTAQTMAFKSKDAGASVNQKQPLWMAVSISPSSGKMGMTIGITEEIAKANANKECGTADCLSILSFQGDSCTAMGSGMNAAGQSLLFMKVGDTEQTAKTNTIKECKNFGSTNCIVHAAQCHDLTP